MIKTLLFLLMPLRKLFMRFGIDFDKMIVIVRYKLTIDSRKQSNVNNSNKKDTNNAQIKTGLGIMVVCSMSFLVLYLRFEPATALFLFHGILLLMMTMTILNEYGELVFDTRDTQILTRMPVSSQTMWTAKIICVIYYFLFYTLCGILFPVIFYAIKYGVLQGLLLTAAGILNVLFSVFFINLIYMVLLRFMSVRRFQQVINYIRMGLGGILALGYMLLNNRSIGDFSVSFGMWDYLIPLSWFTAFNFLPILYDVQTLIKALSGIIVPAFTLFISVKWFAPYFMRKVGNITAATFYSKNRGRISEKLVRILTSLLTSSPLSRAGFMFSWRLSSGNKYFKQLIMPSVMYVIIFIGMQIWKTAKQDEINNAYIVTLYMPTLLAGAIVEALRYVKSGNLFWFFRAKPINKPGVFLLGAFKGIYIKYFLPFYLIIAAILLFIVGFDKILQLVFSFCAITLFAMMLMKFSYPAFPFSMERKVMESMKGFITMIGILIASVILAMIQILLSKIQYAIPVTIVILCVALWFVGKSFRKITWEKIERQYNLGTMGNI